jgi:hypothetical protein
MDDFKIKERFDEALKKVENSIRLGFDREKKRWFPHGSLEGGTPTLAYGYKLTPVEVSTGLIKLNKEEAYLNYKNGLTELEAELLYVTSRNRAESIAKDQWELYANTDVSWEDLPIKYKLVLINIVYNVGTLVKGRRWVWPSLRNAILDENDRKVREEMLTSYTDPHTKVRVYLKNRRDTIADAIGLDK